MEIFTNVLKYQFQLFRKLLKQNIQTYQRSRGVKRETPQFWGFSKSRIPGFSRVLVGFFSEHSLNILKINLKQLRLP